MDQGQSGRGGHTRHVGSPRGRQWTEGLAPNALGLFDNRALRFFEDRERTAVQSAPDAILPHDTPTLTDARLLGSYNWTGQSSPVLLIPGSPPIWKNDPMPFNIPSDGQISRDDGGIVADPAGWDGQATSVLAMLAAVSECTAPDAFQWSTCDFVSDRNSLRHLLRWAGQWGKLDDFRIDLSLVGAKTVVLTRWNRHVSEWAPSTSGYGTSFKIHQTMAAPGCEVTAKGSHDRIVNYRFGELNIVCRFEADACLSDAPDPEDQPMPSADQALASFGPLQYKQVGRLVPQQDVIEFVTRSRKAALKRDEQYVQLLFGALRHLKIAVHDGAGTFTRLQEETVEQIPPPARVLSSLKQLRILLEAIQQVVGRYGKGTRLTLLNRAKTLEVFVREEGVVLPQEFEAAFI